MELRDFNTKAANYVAKLLVHASHNKDGGLSSMANLNIKSGAATHLYSFNG